MDSSDVALSTIQGSIHNPGVNNSEFGYLMCKMIQGSRTGSGSFSKWTVYKERFAK